MTNPELRERVAAVLALAEKATPGPWFKAKEFAWNNKNKWWWEVQFGDKDVDGDRAAFTPTLSDGDAAFIAAAHDMARIIDEQQAEIERLRIALFDAEQWSATFQAERDRLRAEVERLDACRKAHLLQANDSLHEVAELIHDNEELVKAANIEAMENDHLCAENKALRACLDAVELEARTLAQNMEALSPIARHIMHLADKLDEARSHP